MVSHRVVLGHIVPIRGILIDVDKVKVILNLEPPQIVKEVQNFMGHMNYYHKLMKDYVELSRPIYRKIHSPGWTKQCEVALQKLKKNLATTPILKAPVWDVEFHVHTNAYAYAYAISSILT